MIRRALDFRYRGADRGLQVAHMLEGGGQRLGQRLREPASLTGSPSKAIVGDTRCFFKFCLNQKDGRKAGINGDFRQWRAPAAGHCSLSTENIRRGGHGNSGNDKEYFSGTSGPLRGRPSGLIWQISA
jgi:hypothetical protein